MNVIKPIRTTSYATYTRASTATYFDSAKVMQTAAVNAPRVSWNPETGAFEGVLIEPARTNLLLNSATLSTQTRTVTNSEFYTLSFFGTGAITLSGAFAGTLQGTGVYPTKRVTRTFVTSGTSLTLTVSGTVQYAQLEVGLFPTSYIPTTSAPATRAADVVTGAGLFVSTFPQPVADWAVGTTYVTGNTMHASGRLYESLVDANTGNAPAANPSKWLDVGPSNPLACLDNVVSTPSTAPASAQVFAIKLPSSVSACALMAVTGARAHVAVNSGAGSISSQSTTHLASVNGATTTALTGFAPGQYVSVWIAGDTSVSIGEFIAGTFHQLGATQYGHSFSITDYSRKDTDEFGTTTFLKRATAKRMSVPVRVPKGNYNNVVLLMESITSTPTVWIASDDPEYSAGAVVYGNWADFDLEIAYPTENLCNLEIQGLI